MKLNNISKIKFSNIDNHIEWLICYAIFSSHYLEIIIISICCILKWRVKHSLSITKGILSLICIIGIYSIITITLTSYSYSKFLQQFLLLSYYLITYSILLSPTKTDIISLFDKYLKVSYIVALLGIFQWLFFITCHINPFEFLYHRPLFAVNAFTIRITSIIDEPGYLSIVLTPAVTYYLKYDLWPINKKKIIIFTVFVFTISAVSYVVIALVLISKIRRQVIVLLCCVTPLITIGILHVTSKNDNSTNIFDGVTERIEDSINGIQYFDPVYFEQLNLSSYTLISNLWVATHAPNRIIGTGLGTHEQNYYSIYKSDFQYYGFNSKDGYSLFNRIFSEFGLVGISVLLFFILKYYNKKSIVNICAFFLLLSFIIKGGHYVRYGIIFWSYIYYFTKQGHITLSEIINENPH